MSRLEVGELVELAHLVPDHHPDIPERMQERAKEAFLGRADAAVEEHQQIDVGVQAQVAAAVAAERDDRDRTCRSAGLGEEAPQQRVDAVGVRSSAARPPAPRAMSPRSSRARR